MKSIITFAFGCILTTVIYGQRLSDFYLTDSLICSNAFKKSIVLKRFSGPILREEKIIGEVTVVYYVDTSNKELFKVIKTDSLHKIQRVTTLYYHKNKLVKAESWAQTTPGEINYFNLFYYRGDALVSSLRTKDNAAYPNYYLSLAKEYLDVLLK